MKLFECVPNFSEGRDEKIISSIAKIFQETQGITVLHLTSDVDHNRSVITMTGDAKALKEALCKAVLYAKEHIDLRKHKGIHPRMGAFDVVPLIPLEDSTMEDAIALSKEVGKALYETCGVPVFLYEKSASAPHRAPLENLRRGGFEAMGEKLKTAEFAPDFGKEVHPTYGITAVGAREFLIAYNIVLDTPNVQIAKDIAKKIRQSSGGFPCVKAIGLFLEDSQKAQVSINLTDYRVTSIAKVFSAVNALAVENRVSIKKSELIGLLPMEAVLESFEEFVKLEDFSRERILEMALKGRFSC